MVRIRGLLPIVRRKTTRVSRRHLHGDIQRIFRISARIPSVVHAVMLASSNMILWNREVTQVVWRLDYGGHETRCDVVLDVAMEEPHSRIVGPEPPYG